MFGLGGAELAIIGAIAFLFFGPKKIPELAKGLGQGLTSFKKGLKEDADEQIDAPESKEA